MKLRRSFFTVLLLLLAVAVLSACRGRPRTEYYVSPTGSDTTGDGSMARPWRHIQYALDNIDYTSDPGPRLNIMKGIYDERVVVRNSIFIQGVGVGPVSTLPESPLIPIGDVSLITRPDTVPSGAPGFIVDNASGVTIVDLVISGGLVLVEDSGLTIDNIEILDVVGEYGIRFLNSTYFLLNSKIWTRQPLYWSDLGVDSNASTGVIDGLHVGDHFDHTINILRGGTVSVINTTIAGSPISYADGIRIQSPMQVTIRDTDIIRDHPDAEAPHDSYNHPHAGISVGGVNYSGSIGPLVRIENVRTSGFDVGLGTGAFGFRVRVQDSQLSGGTYAAQTVDVPEYADQILDYGGGPLGSAGGNTFGADESYGFYHEGPYDVHACGNDWGVPFSRVGDRIYDSVENSSLGTLFWLGCEAGSAEEAIVIDTPEGEELQRILTDTPAAPAKPVAEVLQNAFCRRGDSTNHDTVRTFQAGQQVELDAVNPAGTWYRVKADQCWMAGSLLALDPELELTVVQPPPPPTPTPTPTQLALPSAPSNFGISQKVCDAQQYLVTLSWGDVSGEEGYRLYRDGQVVAELGADTTQFMDDVSQDYNAHTWGVEAFNSAGASSRPEVSDGGCVY